MIIPALNIGRADSVWLKGEKHLVCLPECEEVLFLRVQYATYTTYILLVEFWIYLCSVTERIIQTLGNDKAVSLPG